MTTMTPGSGFLFTRLSLTGEDTLTTFQEGVRQGVPVLTSHHRVSHFVGGPHGKNKILGIVSNEVRQAVGELNRIQDAKAKTPVVNRGYMAGFYKRIETSEDEIIESLGVAEEMTSIRWGLTPKGGGILFVYTGERKNNMRIRNAWEVDDYLQLKGTDLCKFVEDVAVLTALAKINRRVIYWQLCQATGWTRRTAKLYDTITSGVFLPDMTLYRDKIWAHGGTTCCAWSASTTDHLLVVTPTGSENTLFPVLWTEHTHTVPVNRVRIQASAFIHEGEWNVYFNEK